MRQGISNINIRRLRTGAGKGDTSKTNDERLKSIHETRYCIPIDHLILNDHGVFSPYCLKHDLKFELKMAPVNDIVVCSDTTKAPNYKLKNMELEYRYIDSEYLANQTMSAYKIGTSFKYENINLFKTSTFSQSNDGILNLHINSPRRSVLGILCFFYRNTSRWPAR